MPDYPMHPKPSRIRRHNTGVAEGLPEEFTVGRYYHSLYAIPEKLPACFDVTAQSAHGVGDAVILGVRRRNLPLEAVQFHPQSILSARDDLGLRRMRNAMRLATRNTARLRRKQFASRGPPIFRTAGHRFLWFGVPFRVRPPGRLRSSRSWSYNRNYSCVGPIRLAYYARSTTCFRPLWR